MSPQPHRIAQLLAMHQCHHPNLFHSMNIRFSKKVKTKMKIGILWCSRLWKLLKNFITVKRWILSKLNRSPSIFEKILSWLCCSRLASAYKIEMYTQLNSVPAQKFPIERKEINRNFCIPYRMKVLMCHMEFEKWQHVLLQHWMLLREWFRGMRYLLVMRPKHSIYINKWKLLKIFDLKKMYKWMTNLTSSSCLWGS